MFLEFDFVGHVSCELFDFLKQVLQLVAFSDAFLQFLHGLLVQFLSLSDFLSRGLSSFHSFDDFLSFLSFLLQHTDKFLVVSVLDGEFLDGFAELLLDVGRFLATV